MPSAQNREEVLFALALEKPADLRPGLLDAMCASDTALRERLEALLAAHEQPGRCWPCRPAFSPDGNSSGVVSRDGFLNVWSAPSMDAFNP